MDSLYGDDAEQRRLRRRLEDLEGRGLNQSRPSQADQSSMALLGRVVDGGAMPTEAGDYFLVNPVRWIAGPPTEGGTATLHVLESSRVPVLVLGPEVPQVGDLLVARAVRGGRWVAQWGRKRVKVCVTVHNGCLGGLPLVANVVLKQGTDVVASGATDATEKVCFDRIPAGSYTVEASSAAYTARYATVTTPLTVGASDTNLTVALGAAPGYHCCGSVTPPIKNTLSITDALGTHLYNWVNNFCCSTVYDHAVAETYKCPTGDPCTTYYPGTCFDPNPATPGNTPIRWDFINCFELMLTISAYACQNDPFNDGCFNTRTKNVLLYWDSSCAPGGGIQPRQFPAGFPGTPHLPPWTFTFPATLTVITLMGVATIANPVAGTVIVDEV